MLSFGIWRDGSSQLCFLHSGYRSAKDLLNRKVNTVFGEHEGISEVSDTASYSILLQERQRETQRPKPRNWKSSNYRVVDKWSDYICSYFFENHDFVPAKDAFCNELNKRFKRSADDAWALKRERRLWINTAFHLLGEVVQKLKEDRTQAILVVPLWNWKPWCKDVLAMTVDSIRLPHDVKLYARDDTCPLRQRPWPTVAFLGDGGLISDRHRTMGQNQDLTMVLSHIPIVPIFWKERFLPYTLAQSKKSGSNLLMKFHH